MRVLRYYLWALIPGLLAGLLALVLVVRINAGLELTAAELGLGALVWASWGAVVWAPIMGLGLAVLGFSFPWPRNTRRWPVPELSAAVFLAFSGLCEHNADVYRRHLSGTAHRLLNQDAAMWAIAALLTVLLGAWTRRRGPGWLAWFAVAILALGVPIARVAGRPTPPRQPEPVQADPLGSPARQLLLLAVDGFDVNLLQQFLTDERLIHLEGLASEGAWGALEPHRPFVEKALWTTAATGARPSRHGVTADTTYRLGEVWSAPIQVLPWTPWGGRLLLPWGLAREIGSPRSAVPPLWARLPGTTLVVGWPDPRHWRAAPAPVSVSRGQVPADIAASLDAVLTPRPELAPLVWGALLDDLATVAAVEATASRPPDTVVVRLRSLALVRRLLEPARPADTTERAVLELAVEITDEMVGRLLALRDDDALVAVVAPYGYRRPDAWERLLRLAGTGPAWRATPERCPDGLLLLNGPGVQVGQRIQRARLADLVPTLAYLLELPVAQSMEGYVLLEAVQPEMAQRLPLRVVE